MAMHDATLSPHGAGSPGLSPSAQEGPDASGPHRCGHSPVRLARVRWDDHGRDRRGRRRLAADFLSPLPSKEAVLYGDMDDLLERFRDNLELRPADEPLLVSVRESILALAVDYEDQRKLRLLQARLAASSPAVSAYSRAVVQQAWERELGESLARRLGVDPVEDPRPEIIAAAAMSALRHSIRRWARSRGREELPALVAQSLDAVFELAATSGALV